MDKRRDNEIARDIISGKITELYCIRPGYFYSDSNQTLWSFGQKYKVWSGYTMQTINGERCKDYYINIHDNIGRTQPLMKNKSISDYFETSFKEVRKNKLKKINQYQNI